MFNKAHEMAELQKSDLRDLLSWVDDGGQNANSPSLIIPQPVSLMASLFLKIYAR